MATRLTSVTVAMLLALPAAAGTLRDPTALPRSMTRPTAEMTTAEPVLRWVRVSSRGSIAWYGGSAVKVGDATEGGRVSAIHEDHIVISSKRGHRSVYLLDRSNRTEPPTRPGKAR